MSPLEQNIRDAFAGLDPPADGELLHSDCRDDVDIQDFYGGVRWQDMTGEMIIRNYAAPPAFSAKAFRYYLPVYLIWTLDNMDSPEIAAESILLALDSGTDRELLHDFRTSKFALLDSPQVAAVKAFLMTVSDHPDLGPFAENALVNYWLDR